MKKNFSLSFLIIALLTGAFLAAPIAVQSQGRDSRMSRLREHERKIQEIIRQRRAEKQKAEEERRQQEIQDRRDGIVEEEQPQEDEPQRAISNVVMGFKFLNEEGDADYNIIVNAGETFLTEVQLFNVDQNPVDRIRLALDYDKRFIQPVKVFDTDIRGFVAEEPQFRVENREAILIYDVKLKEPIRSPEAVLLKILWKAVRPTPYTGIEFAFSELERDQDIHTAIYAGESNILGVADDPADGVLSGGLMIQSGDEEKGDLLQGKAEELRDIYLGSVASDTQVGLVLKTPEEPVRVGDEFDVRVMLNNPEGALVDSINFAVLFDPTVFQAVDNDKFNFIIRGINIQDGLYHESFPWDMHKQNEVRNDRGLAQYRKGLSNGASLPSKTFASIRFKAIAPTSGSPIGFVKGRPGAPDMTSVRYFGYERLDLKGEISRPSVLVPVLPGTRDVASKESSEQESEALTQEDMQVRSLKIER